VTEETTTKRKPGRKPDPLTAILAEVRAERKQQDEQWGEQNHPLVGGSDPELSRAHYEGRATAWKNANGFRAKWDNMGWDSILIEEVYEALAEEDEQKARAELIQVAAVALTVVEAIDRRATE
jgi:hypothetical protein